MPASVQVRRLVRVRASVRDAQFPLPPELPESFVRRFPELADWNREFLIWAERVQTLFEAKNPEQDVS